MLQRIQQQIFAEKSLVMNMIRVAISGQAKYWKQYPPLEIESFHKTTLPPINKVTPEPSGEINRFASFDILLLHYPLLLLH